VSRRDLAGDRSDLAQKTRGDEYGGLAESDLAGPFRPTFGGSRFAAAYQVTSPAPERTFATRASIKSKSESRFR
jgi:hypothetical protein